MWVMTAILLRDRAPVSSSYLQQKKSSFSPSTGAYVCCGGCGRHETAVKVRILYLRVRFKELAFAHHDPRQNIPGVKFGTVFARIYDVRPFPTCLLITCGFG
jgi:hypothetical protein